MAAAAMKHMASNIAKLDKFVRVNFGRCQKKGALLAFQHECVNVESFKELWDSLEAKYMVEDASSKKLLVSNFINYKMPDSRPVLEQYNELLGILGRFTQHNMNMDESIQVSCIIDKLPLLKDFKHTLKHLKEELTLVELGSQLRIEKSLRMQDNDKPKGNNVVGPSVFNIIEHNNSSKYNDNKGKRKHHDNTKADSNKKSKVTYWKCGKPRQLKRIAKVEKLATKPMVYYVTYVSEAYFVQYDGVAWWVNSGAIVHVCKDRCWFKTYESPNDGFILHMGNESTALVHGRGCVDLKFSSGMIVSYNLCDLHATPSLGNKKYVVTFIDDTSRTDRGGEYMDTLYFQSVGIIHEMNAPYTTQQNGISERKNSVLKEMVNFMLSYSGLSQWLWGEAMLTSCYLLNLFPNKRNMITLYELWTKRKPNLNYLRVWGCRTVVRLPDPKLKTLGENGIKCIFVGYAEHSKAFRFYVIEPNASVSINSIIESRDAIFDENRFSLVPRPSLRISNGTEDIGGTVAPKEVTEEVVQQPEPELRKSKRNRTPKYFGHEFQIYLIERKRDKVSDQHSYCFNAEDDPKTFNKAMKSPDVTFWKEAINDEIDSIMGNNTWVLAYLPPG
ncbi:zinc finger, CCHC-type containing protein, partial [Tanacetum coccineum]